MAPIVVLALALLPAPLPVVIVPLMIAPVLPPPPAVPFMASSGSCGNGRLPRELNFCMLAVRELTLPVWFVVDAAAAADVRLVVGGPGVAC